MQGPAESGVEKMTPRRDQTQTQTETFRFFQKVDVPTTASGAALSLGNTEQIRQRPWATLPLPLLEGLGLFFVPQLETGSCPCLSRELLCDRRRKSQATPDWSPPMPHALCLPHCARQSPGRRAWGTWKPSPPSEQGPRVPAPPPEVAAVSARSRAFRGTRIARPQDREALSLKHGPPPRSRKDHMLGGPEVSWNC